MASDTTSEAEDAGAPFLIRRFAGRWMGELRETARVTQISAGKAIQRHRQHIIRMEDGGQIVWRDLETRALLDLYQADETSRRLILGMTKDLNSKSANGSVWHTFTEEDIPTWFELYVRLEDVASTVREYQPELMPGLAQTEAYATAIMRAEGTTPESIQRRVEVRMKRQALLTRANAPEVEVILSEAAIRRLITIDELAEEQLSRLLELSELPNVDLRLLTYSAGLHPGMAATGGFILLDFPVDRGTGKLLEPPLAYSDGPAGALYLTKPQQVDTYKQIWEGIRRQAHDPQATRLALKTFLEGLPK